MSVTLIADSGATKAEWCLLKNGKKNTFFTQGISPYFLNRDQISELLKNELVPLLKQETVEEVFYYGTGCANPKNAALVKQSLKKVFHNANIKVETDLMAAARALCNRQKGIACILGTGMCTGFYNGKTLVKENFGLGYVLGDEGSGAYLGKKVLQYYLYNTFDEDLKALFDAKYVTTKMEILDQVYKKPFPSRYLASFAIFLAENRGHYVIENIIEDGLNDFFFHHLCKYAEIWKYPVNFVGSIANGFKDVIVDLCNSYEFECGRILKNPMEGLIEFHQES
jgi:N-acetylglucosamine kinase-like BadF-type ATPase